MVLNVLLTLISFIVSYGTYADSYYQIVNDDVFNTDIVYESTLNEYFINIYYKFDNDYINSDDIEDFGFSVYFGNQYYNYYPTTYNDIYLGSGDTDGWYGTAIYKKTISIPNGDFELTDNIRINAFIDLYEDNVTELDYGIIFYTSFELLGELSTFDEGYSEGFSDGYDYGLDTGYDSGYNSGYAQGQIDYTNNADYTDSVITRMWDIFASAGAVVLNVFTMNVLPGIPLYMLIFFPILIAIIIFIVRSLSK